MVVWKGKGTWRRRCAAALRHAGSLPALLEPFEPRRMLSGTPVITQISPPPIINENGVLVLSGTYTDTAASDSLTVNWGDGTTPDTLAVTGGVFVFAHRYLYPSANAPAGKFPIQLSLANNLSQTATASTAISVTNVAPANVAITLQGTTPAPLNTGAFYATVYEGSSLTLTGAYTDVGTLDTQTTDWHVVSTNGQTFTDGTGSSFTFSPNNNGPNGATAQYVVAYTVTDNYGGVGAAPPFFVTVVDSPPTIALTAAATTRAGSPFTLTLGAITDAGKLDVVTGYKIDWGDGTVQDFTGAGSPANSVKTHTYAGAAGSSYAISMTLIDNDGTHAGAGAASANIINAAGNTIAGRYTFYADSTFAGAGADAAIATDKSALLPGHTASFANYTSYDQGLNGIMVDIAGTVGTITASDFAFKIGNSASTTSWTAAPAPISVVVHSGDGVAASNRVQITWADGVMKDTWLQVTVLADSNTGLAADDVFYFGNAIGSAGISATSSKVTAIDQITVRDNALGAGNTYYVSPAGSDTGNGSATAPWATLQHAADTAVAGDTVIVRAGTYNGMNIIGVAGGTQASPIRFIANTGAVITHAASEGINASLAGINIENTGGWYVIEGFDVESDGSMQRAGIRVANSNNVTLINNVVNHAYIGIFASDSSQLLIQENTCENSTDQHGIYISGCSLYTILGNILFGNNWDGLHLNISGDMPNTGGIVENNYIWGNSLSGIDMEGVTNSYFVNNIIFSNGKHGISLHNLDQANTPACTGNLFINNTITSNGGFAIQMQAGGNVLNMLFNNILLGSGGPYGSIGISGDPTGLLSDHNIVTNSFSDDLGVTQMTLAQWQTFTQTSSTTHFTDDAASFVAASSQLFANPAAGNFQLFAGSVAINAGVGAYLGQAAPASDANGATRPVGNTWDIGAYEFGSAANPAIFALSTPGAPINDPYDVNRDGRVDASDEAVIRANQTTAINALKLITAPGALSLLPADDLLTASTTAADPSPTSDTVDATPTDTSLSDDVSAVSTTTDAPESIVISAAITPPPSPRHGPSHKNTRHLTGTQKPGISTLAPFDAPLPTFHLRKSSRRHGVPLADGLPGILQVDI